MVVIFASIFIDLLKKELLINFLESFFNCGKGQVKIKFLKDLNFLFSYILKIPKEEYLEILKQSIPEKDPILYTETTLKVLQ